MTSTGMVVLAPSLAVPLGLALAAALLGAGVAPSAAGSGPLVGAHRGGALLWPENSLLAFRNALALGVDFIETDVHLTADGETVILHDPTLDRTTTGSGAVRDVRLADLAPLRLRTADGIPTGEGIPTLAQVLDLVRDSTAALLLEIKTDSGGRRYDAIEEKVLTLVRARGLGARAVIMGFEAETVRRIRQLDPAIRAALLVRRGRTERERVRPAEAVRLAVAAGATGLGMNHRLIDGEVVAAARRAGVRLLAWTVNTEPDVRRVQALGADVVITDRPDLALRVLGRRAP